MSFPSAALCFAVVAATAAHPGTSRAAQSDYRDSMDRVSDLVVMHEYRAAESILDSLGEAYPSVTDIRFQRLVLLFTWIDDYGIADSLGGQFLATVDTVIRLGDRDTRNNADDKWAWFFKGSAYAYRSLYRSYVEGIGLGNIRSLVSDATTGVDNLERASRVDTSFTDPLIGIGKYLHWKSKKLPWPFASAKDGERGIHLLETAIRKGVLADAGAVQTLGWMYISERRYDDAIALVHPMMDRYPASRFFSEIVARAYQGKGSYAQAESLYVRMLNGLSPNERASNFIVMKYQRWIARLRYEQGKRNEACRMAQRLRQLDYPGVHRDWLDRKMGEVNKVISDACGR